MPTKLRSLLPSNKITNLLGETNDNHSVTYNSIILIIIINLHFYLVFNLCYY